MQSQLRPALIGASAIMALSAGALAQTPPQPPAGPPAARSAP
jgi:hypothetical protein